MGFKRVFVTGDTHGNIEDLKKRCNDNKLSEEDLLIIAGDFGFIWDDSREDNLKEILASTKPHIWFIDGNHENFGILNNGCINDNQLYNKRIKHIERGEVLSVCGKTILCCGGGISVDKGHRLTGITRRPQEELNRADAISFLFCIELYQYVDYIITHEGNSILYNGRCDLDKESNHKIKNSEYKKSTEFQELFDKISQDKYGHWYCGHYHKDIDIDDKHTIVYNNIIQLI